MILWNGQNYKDLVYIWMQSFYSVGIRNILKIKRKFVLHVILS